MEFGLSRFRPFLDLLGLFGLHLTGKYINTPERSVPVSCCKFVTHIYIYSHSRWTIFEYLLFEMHSWLQAWFVGSTLYKSMWVRSPVTPQQILRLFCSFCLSGQVPSKQARSLYRNDFFYLKDFMSNKCTGPVFSFCLIRNMQNIPDRFSLHSLL